MQILGCNKNNVVAVLRQVRQAQGDPADMMAPVRLIMAAVKRNGDRALLRYTQAFDGAKLTRFSVTPAEIRAAYKAVAPELLVALRRARQAIVKFHKAGLVLQEKTVTTVRGVKAWREFRPIEKVGLYAPGGTAAYPSTVLMLALPAKIAGCREIVLCTPPGRDGKVAPATLVAANLCGVTKIFKLGGAQAVAAMAYGTESVPAVYKIFGPGNRYVTAAKMLAYGTVDIDMPAGPSELMIITDESAPPEWLAADLLSQLEHGPDSQSVLVTFSAAYARKVRCAMEIQMAQLSRQNILAASYPRSFAIVANDIVTAIKLANAYAPEHLELIVRAPRRILPQIVNTGSVFLGPYSSEPLGDYCTGTNHTLPTSGFARMFAALSVDQFGKMMQVQEVTRGGLQKIAPIAATIAMAEGLDAHREAVMIRLKK